MNKKQQTVFIKWIITSRFLELKIVYNLSELYTESNEYSCNKVL